jgi:Ca2+/Na+ antiporter
MVSNRFHQKWYNQFITFPIITGIAAVMIYDSLKQRPLLSSLVFIIKAIWKYIIVALTFKISVFWIIIALLLIIFVLFLLSNSKKVFDPKLQYTTDVLINWRWEWTYSGRYIQHLTPLCPSCNTIMNYRNGHSQYDKFAECPRCNKCYATRDSQRQHTDIMEFEDDKRIEMLIIDNIRKGNYKHL